MLAATLRGLAAVGLRRGARGLHAAAERRRRLPPTRRRSAQTVQFGTVVSARGHRSGQPGRQAAGAIVGGIAGAALGQNVGGGTGQVLATGAGATAGAAAGLQAGKAVAGHQSIEWTVRLESGRTIAVIQAEPVFAVGQRVQVITGGGTTRLAAA